MIKKLKKKFRKKYDYNIDPDEIFIDSSNLPGFDNSQFEGRMEKPISDQTFLFLGVIFILVFLVFSGRVWSIQIAEGEKFAKWGESNKLRNTLLFPDRGLIYDRNGVALAWNEHRDDRFSTRKYTETPGFYNLLGYISYPKRDSAGFFYEDSLVGTDGVEKLYNNVLAGINGERIIEINAVNEVVSENVVKSPESGRHINLTVDYDVQKQLHDSVKKIIDDVGFEGGGAVIMDVHSGDLLSLVSYPEYDSNILTEAKDDEKISEYINDSRNPFINKITEGQYTPGSIIKPFVAAAALQENVINPTDKIVSRGTLVVPNRYDSSNPSIFTDWKAHGEVDVREALAYSSNIYFYVAGGGFDDIEGLGITKMNDYLKRFGFGEEIHTDVFSTGTGTVPSPEWKRKIFDDNWRLGDTYFTAIGQYGFQVIPLQMVRGIGALATNGVLIEPNLISDSTRVPKIKEVEGINNEVYEIVQAGMRDAVEFGTAKGLNYSDFKIAAKTGTAELGTTRQKVNSWLVGYWPYENPKYAFVIFLEQGDRSNLIGGVAVARNFFDWLKVEKPEYLQ